MLGETTNRIRCWLARTYGEGAAVVSQVARSVTKRVRIGGTMA